MTATRRAELTCGVLSWGLGLITLIVALFAPLESTVSTICGQGTASCTTVTSHESIVQNQGLASVAGVLLLGILIFTGIVIGALLDAGRNAALGRGILWVATVLLTAGLVLAIASIGMLFIPAWGLAVAASVLALVRAADWTAPTA
jgi:hypothetical protein